MMRGEKTGLRARHEADVPVFQTELYNDVATRSRAEGRAWRPVAPGTAEAADARKDAVGFSVVELDTQALAGECLVWGIDRHNRSAHLGISLLPGHRGRGFGSDVVRVLCEYGFAVCGMQRLQVETLADNASMIGAATNAGFKVEGTLRRSAWVYGAFADQVLLGLLADEWTS